jgi:hypothetical protein
MRSILLAGLKGQSRQAYGLRLPLSVPSTGYTLLTDFG